MNGLGQMSWNMLSAIGITSPEALQTRDPFEVYATLHRMKVTRSVNMLYALIGAIENKHWQEIARDRRMEILVRLDHMQLAPCNPAQRARPRGRIHGAQGALSRNSRTTRK
jgi:DNA transformation protein and related proteins